jgi:GT2 family glycosyltransferase
VQGPPPTIAVSIKTMARPEHLRSCIESVRRYLSLPHRFYIADDSAPGETDEHLLHELRGDGHVVKRYATPVPVTRARNELCAELRDETHLLRMDDDFVLTSETSIEAMLAILDANPSFGAVAGVERQLGPGRGTVDGGLSPHQGYFALRDRTLHKQSIPVDAWLWTRLDNGVRFAIADYTRNMLLVRRVALDTVRWNEDLVFHGEHEAFMLDLKQGGWILAFTPDSEHHHNEKRKSADRNRQAKEDARSREAMLKTFRTQYGVDDFSLTYPIGKYRS